MSDYYDYEEHGPMSKAVVILGGGLMLAIWVLNTIFTFTYGTGVIGPFLLVDELGVEGSRLLSGIVSVTFYDLAYTVGFVTLLFGCQSTWQYAVVGLQFVFTLLLSIAASVVSIILLSPLGEHVPQAMMLVASYVGYAALVAGFIVNCIASIGYVATSPHMSEVVRKSMSLANRLGAKQRRDKQLAKDVAREADKRLNDYLPALVQVHAEERVRGFLASQGFGDPATLQRVQELAAVEADNHPTQLRNGHRS